MKPINTGAVMATLEAAILEQDHDEVMALGRMVSYACQRSKLLNLGMSTYFLEMALMSLVQDIGERGLPASDPGHGSVPADITELH